MSKEIVKINHEDFGLEESKAKQIADQFKPMLDKMQELEKEANGIFKLDITDPETQSKAKELRLKYVKVRTGTAAIHKAQKSFYLAGGKFVDGWKNAQIFASQGLEEKLKAIEDHQKIEEQKRLDELKKNRESQILELGSELQGIQLELMTDEVFENYKKGVELSLKAQKEEAERLKKEDEEKQLKIKLYNDRKEKLIPFWNFLHEDHKSCDFGELPEESFDIILNEAKQSKTKSDQEAEKIKKAKEKAERENKKLKKQQADHAKIEADKKKKIEAEKSKTDVEKFSSLIDDFEMLKHKYEFDTEEFRKKQTLAVQLIDKTIKYLSDEG